MTALLTSVNNHLSRALSEYLVLTAYKIREKICEKQEKDRVYFDDVITYFQGIIFPLRKIQLKIVTVTMYHPAAECL